MVTGRNALLGVLVNQLPEEAHTMTDRLELACGINTLPDLIQVLLEVKASPERVNAILNVATMGMDNREVELGMYSIKINERNPMDRKVEQWLQQIIDLRFNSNN